MKLAGTIALLGLVVLFGCSTSREEDEKFIRQQEELRNRTVVPVRGLALALTVPRPVYQANEMISLELRLVNAGREDLNLYAELEPEGWLITLEVSRAGGAIFYRSPPVALKQTRERSHYVALRPGHFVGRTIQVPASRFRPGLYEFRLTYHNQRYDYCLASPKLSKEDVEHVQDRAFVTLWKGIVQSNVVRVEVK